MQDFYIGAATAAHQVEGNNIHSDYWVQENLEHSMFVEPSGRAVDHYNRYQEDIDLMKEAGLDAYRFSIEWARIEPEEGVFDEQEIAHYLNVIKYCLASGLEPVVTLMHFTSPAWLITKGGWENPEVVEYFGRYTEKIVSVIGPYVKVICTINEANMRLQLQSLMKSMMARMSASQDQSKAQPAGGSDTAKNIQVGLNMKADMQSAMMESARAFGVSDPRKIATFVSACTPEGDILVMKAHQKAKEVIKNLFPEIQVGLTLSLHDMQVVDGAGAAAAEKAAAEWNDEFVHYLPYIGEDDFLGVQCYTRKCFDASGEVAAPDAGRLTQMGYEGYAPAIGNVVRTVAKDFHGDLYVTENGLATDDDEWRCEFVKEAVGSVLKAKADGIPVKGYFYWSLLDNFEWQRGFSMTFGLISVDRDGNMARYPKESLRALGNLNL